MTNTTKYTDDQLDELAYSVEYAEFIMNNGSHDRVICNSETLLCAMEDSYLFDEFLESLSTSHSTNSNEQR